MNNPEYLEVELPFIAQLQALGWEYLPGDTQVPSFTERTSFRQVFLTERLRQALRRINLDEQGRPWLDAPRLTQAVDRLERLGQPNLIEANQAATELLLKGTAVEGPAGGKHVTIHYLDFDHPERNDFLVINQFRVDPLWAAPGRDYCIPDLVLFVNGIPLVVVEAKSPRLEEPLTEAIRQLLRYSNRREEACPAGGGVREPEGVEPLFHTAQLLVATCGETARLGTVGADYRHYQEWKDPYPLVPAQVAADLGVAQLSGQQTLVAGVLTPAHLLDIVRNFTCFTQVNGQTVKLVPRYQQFRAVHKAVERLQTGATRLQQIAQGVPLAQARDERGGLIWHTQGSGKSFTMVFLVRKLRTLPALRRYKVIFVTDRTDLERQLTETASLAGEPLQKVGSVAQFHTVLAEPGAGLVFAMIQKAQDVEADLSRGTGEEISLLTNETPNGVRGDKDVDAEVVIPHRSAAAVRNPVPPQRDSSGAARPRNDIFPELNASPDILLLVDEAHRSHAKTLHANLMAALPNAAKIGFTGTPILEEDQKRTTAIFGPFIDTYTISESQADGATVPILYEGRKVTAHVREGGTLDARFAETFWEYTPLELEAIKARYATTGDVLEAEPLIAFKAADMLRHYVSHALADGFKAQVVAVSRRAAVRYQHAFEQARRALVAELETALRQGAATWEAQAIPPLLRRLRRLQFCTVISGLHNDPRTWSPWTSKGQQEAAIADFKTPFDDEKQQGYTAILIVKSMLLTGFDAPIEQVMYLDRPIRGYELLQAIARVNRTQTGKEAGLIVDYYGLAQALKEALELYSDGDRRGGGFQPFNDELPRLADRHQRVVFLFTARGGALADTEACVELLRETRLRAEFVAALHDFQQSLNLVLPRPAALPYVKDAQQLGLIRAKAFQRYRDEHLNIAGAEAKVRQLIDTYVAAQGIDVQVPPVDILAAEFEQQVGQLRSPRAQAAEMEFAARHHIRQHYQEDPVFYQKLSERLEQILQLFADHWEAQVAALREFIRSYRQSQAEVEREDRTVQPFLRILTAAAPEPPTAARRTALAQAAVQLVELLRAELRRVDFWRNPVAQRELRSRLLRQLDALDLLPFDQLPAVADQLVQTARANHVQLVGE